MKVWEYCGFIIACERPPYETRVEDYHGNIIVVNYSSWHETTRYEITECKPDYEAMLGGFGAFYHRDDVNRTSPRYGRFTKYLKEEKLPFLRDGLGWYSFFAPCAEPQELDPITMKVKE